MFRFAFAYQGGSPTYLAGGAKIDVRSAAGGLDVASSEALSLTLPGRSLDLAAQDKVLDIEHDGFTVDL